MPGWGFALADWFAWVESLVQQTSGWYFASNVTYPEELDEIISDDMVDRFAIAGTPQECISHLQRIVDMGFQSVSLNLAGVRRGDLYEGLRETITAFGEVIPEVKRL